MKALICIGFITLICACQQRNPEYENLSKTEIAVINEDVSEEELTKRAQEMAEEKS